MLKIAICDSDALAAKKLDESMKDCMKRYGLAAETVCYQDISFLQDLISMDSGRHLTGSRCVFDYIFTEALLPQSRRNSGSAAAGRTLNCLSLLSEIKRSIPSVNFILTTSHKETIFDALRIPVFYFIRKDCLAQDLEAACLKIRDEQTKLPAYRVFTSGTKTVKIAVADILCFESYRHTVTIHTAEGELSLTAALSSVLKDFEGYDFVQTHKSYVVNLYHIKRIETAEVMLSDGSRIPISRYRLPELRGRYDNYIRRLGWLR